MARASKVRLLTAGPVPPGWRRVGSGRLIRKLPEDPPQVSQEQLIADAVAAYCAAHPPADGRAPSAEEIALAVAAYLEAHPPEPGRDASAEQIAAAVSEHFARHPVRVPEPRPGEPGRPGTDGVGIADIVEHKGYIHVHLTDGREFKFKLPAKHTVEYVHGQGGSAAAGGVQSVNGDSGPAVTLDAADVGADPTGTAAAAVAAHEAAGDPHPQYLTAAEGNAAYEAAGAVAAHAAAADPHTGYQKESEKGAAGGYASLDGSGTVPDAQIPAAIARDAEVSAAVSASEAGQVRDGDTAAGDLGGTYPNPTVTQARGLRETAGPTTLALGAVADGEFLKRVGATVVGAAPTATVAYTTFTKDLGAARSAGTFDVTSSGLSAGKVVTALQTSGAIASKGNARDEPEMDRIHLSGYVVDATTIRFHWWAPSVVVGTYEFAYLVSG